MLLTGHCVQSMLLNSVNDIQFSTFPFTSQGDLIWTRTTICLWTCHRLDCVWRSFINKWNLLVSEHLYTSTQFFHWLNLALISYHLRCVFVCWSESLFQIEQKLNLKRQLTSWARLKCWRKRFIQLIGTNWLRDKTAC